MKKVNSLLIATLFALAGCGDSKPPTENLITVDVTEKYPTKELILQDFMDVEYIPLETTDDFLCMGSLWGVGKNLIVATNFNQDGTIFLFDRKGKALRKINRKGEGVEEYVSNTWVLLDDEKGELFVNSGFEKKIYVYDLKGNFKRVLSTPKDLDLSLYQMYNFDSDNLLCNNQSLLKETGQSFILLSKQDGSVTREITIPFEEKKSLYVKVDDKNVEGGAIYYVPQSQHPIVPYLDEYILAEFSADTLYQYSADHTLKPLIVRTPSIQSMNPEIFLLPSLFTDRYYFMVSIEEEINFSTTKIMYDKQDKKLYRFHAYNGDYTYKEEAYLNSRRPINGEIPSWQYLEAPDLVNYYKKGWLKGRLKEIASQMTEDDNPVIMLMKHKQK